MLKIFLIASIFILSNSAAFTQELSQFDCSNYKSLSKSKAQTLLEKTQKTYSTIGSLEADFTQTSYLAAMDMSERSSGNVWFKKPGRMKWFYTDPDEQSFLVRDHTVWFYQKELEQVTISNFKDILISDAPVAFLMGLGNLSDEFSIIEACSSENFDVLELTPKKGREGNLKKFSLMIDPESFTPKGAQVIDIGENRTEIKFLKISLNNEIAEQEFSNNFPKGTDVNDQRSNS